MSPIERAKTLAKQMGIDYIPAQFVSAFEQCEKERTSARIAELEALLRDLDDANKHSVVKVGAWEQQSKLQNRIDAALGK